MEANLRSSLGIFLFKVGFPYLIGFAFRVFMIPLKQFFVNYIFCYENMFLLKTILYIKPTQKASIKDTHYQSYIL